MNMRRDLMLAAAFVTLTASGLAAAAPKDGTAGKSGVSWVSPPDGCGNSGVVNGHCNSGNSGKSVKAIPNPEIDGAGALTAIALLGGVLTLVGERRRQKS